MVLPADGQQPLAESTRVQGLAQLRELGLLTTATRKISESGAFIDQIRRRNVHTLNLNGLDLDN